MGQTQKAHMAVAKLEGVVRGAKDGRTGRAGRAGTVLLDVADGDPERRRFSAVEIVPRADVRVHRFAVSSSSSSRLLPPTFLL